MKIARLVSVAILSLVMAAPAMAQEMGQQPEGDQVDQLAQMIDLSDEQQEEIRGILDEMQDDIQAKQEETQQLQEELDGMIGPDYNEDEIRERASKLGDLTADMTAESILLQARVESVFTEEQREELERQIEEQQQQMQQQMQQQGGGEQPPMQ